MIYHQLPPHPALANYIDAYWTVTGSERAFQIEKILPDGCVDIIFNLGEQCVTDNGLFTMHTDHVYLVGTMTTFKETIMSPDTNLIGIRFKPAAFTAFYKFASLHEIKDVTVEFDRRLAPDLKKIVQSSAAYLDEFFLAKVTKPKHNLLPVVTEIQEYPGQVNLKALADRYCTTPRQLERNFRQHIGAGPKEFLNVARYQSALSKIKNNPTRRSLSDIAFECGYYDHAHLTNEIKRYTGSRPSEL